MSLTSIRDAVATRLATIPGLRTASEIPDQPNPPIAIVTVQNVDYTQAMAKGLTIYNLTVTVIIARVAERYAQRALNDYVSTSGANSIKLAIEGDRTLGGVAYDVQVTNMTSIGAIQLSGDVAHLAAEFSVVVYAA
jgi:hypothetical protein